MVCRRVSVTEGPDMDVDMTAIREHMEVVGDDGEHIGTVDRIEGDMLKLTRSDPQAGGEHHWIPAAWVTGIDQVVRLNMPAHQAIAQWSASGPDMRSKAVGDDDPYAANRERSREGEVH